MSAPLSLSATPPAAPRRSELPDQYLWPTRALSASPQWQAAGTDAGMTRELPETVRELWNDSRWPAFFPSAICHVTTRVGSQTALERLVGASIVNRFPYILALTICRDHLSARHHPRRRFMSMLESSGAAAVQFVAPGRPLTSALHAVASVPDANVVDRIGASGLPTVDAITNDSPVFEDSYLVYEGRLAQPSQDALGAPIFTRPWVDVGSHRIYFLEITAIQLRESIASGRDHIYWRSLPVWDGRPVLPSARSRADRSPAAGYSKGYTPNYRFPSSSTVAFESDSIVRGMAVKFLETMGGPGRGIEWDNDRARWPCFFPSSLGMITTWSGTVPNVMPCGSTMIVSRHPLTIAPCVSYARINDRYAPRATLDLIRETRRFGCGVPYLDQSIVDAIKVAGNVSLASDPRKVARSGLTVRPHQWAPIIAELPIHFDCAVTGEVRLGTHVMFLGEVRRIYARPDLTPETPLEWCPFPDLREGSSGGH